MDFVTVLLIGFALAQSSPAQQQQTVEVRAAAAFAANDCRTAVPLYEQALSVASAPDVKGLFYRRLGICKARLGDPDGSFEAYRAGVQASESATDKHILEENLHGLGLAYKHLGKLKESQELAERQFHLTEKCGVQEHLARSTWLLATVYDAEGKARLSLQLYEQALAIARAAKDSNGISILLDNLASRYAGMGDPDYGIQLEREAIAVGDPNNVTGHLIESYNLGRLQIMAGKSEAAVEVFRGMLEKAVSPADRPVRVGALLKLADAYNRLNRREEAEPYLAQALEIGRQSSRPEWISQTQSFRATLLAALGRVPEAREAAREALRIARESGAPGWEYDALIASGVVADAAGERNTGRDFFQEAVAVAESRRSEAPGDPAQLQAFMQSTLSCYRFLAADLIALGKPADALAIAERAKARVLMDILRAGGVDEQSALSPSEKARENQLREAAARGDKVAGKDAIRDLERFRGSLYLAHPEMILQSGDFEAPDAATLSRLIPDDRTALVEYFTLEQGTAVFVLRRGQPVRAFHIEVPEGEVRRFREALARRELDYKPAARRLYSALLGPALPALRGASDLVISPDGALWELPFAALIDADGQHLLESRSVSLTPSFAALAFLKSRPLPATPLHLLALANPNLPDAGREVTRIGAVYPAAGQSLILTGAHATVDAFQKEAARARIVHVAAHAQLNDSEPLYSTIEMGARKLSGLDLMGMKLHADLVVLSACDTALGKAAPGEGMIGMGWALAAAGARSSVLTYWKVGSGASGDFMVAFHAGLATGLSKAQSLRAAALKTMRDPAQKHPYYWAAFSLQGAAD